MSTEDPAVAAVLAGVAPAIRPVVEALRDLLRSNAPDLREEGKIGQKLLMYKGRQVVCTITPYAKYASLHFYKGTRLNDAFGLLEGNGGALRHIKFTTAAAVEPAMLRPYLEQALALDAAV